MLPSLLIRLLGGAGLVTELCMPLCDPMDGRPAPLPPGPLSMGFPRRILERVAISFSRGSLQPRGGNSASNRKNGRKKSPVELFQFSSVPQSCPTLCDPMNRSKPGLPVHHQLPAFTQTHVHQVGDAIQPSHPLSSPSPPAPNPFQHQGLFQRVNSLHEVAKVLEFEFQHQSFQ